MIIFVASYLPYRTKKQSVSSSKRDYSNPAGCYWHLVCIRKVRELYAVRDYFF